jgi:hypothetical protein
LDKLPFSVYDFFGYLAAGFVLLVGLAAAFVGSDDWQESPPTIVGLLLIVIAYAAGHVVANISGYLYEATLVRKGLKTPTVNLFRTDQPGNIAWLLPGYFKALPEAQRERVLQTAKERTGIDAPSEGLFFHCFGRVKSNEAVMARLNTFLNLYGFCRNMSLSLLLVAIALTIGSAGLGTAHTGRLVPPGWCIVGCVVGGAGLLYRYLKFFRQYAVEVFTSYADLEATRQGGPS